MYNGQKEKHIAALFSFSHSPNVTTPGTIRIDANANRFLAAIDGTASTISAAGDVFKIVMARKGVLKNLYYWALPTSNLTNSTHKFTVLKNGAAPSAPEGLSASWNPATKTGSNLTGYINVLPGDVISVQVQTFAGTGAIIRPTVSFELEVEDDYPSPWDYDPASKIISYTDGDIEVDGIIRSNAGFQFPNGDVQTTAFLGGGGSSEISEFGGKIGIGIDPTDRNPQEKLTLAPNSNLATEMPIPSISTVTPQAGGSLGPSDYTFWVSASDGTGWTKASVPVTRTLPSTNGSFTITWGAVLGATKYRLYRALIAAPTDYKYVEITTTTYSYTDDGPFGPDVPPYPPPPVETTAYINKLSAAGSSWLLGGNLGIGTSNPVVPLQIRPGVIYLDGSPGARVYYMTNGGSTASWALGTDNGEATQNFNLYNYALGQVALSVHLASNGLFGNFNNYSSKRWKKNIQTIKDALSTVKRLRGISYNQKEDDKQTIGLVAEEVGEVIPEIVTYEENGKDAKGLDYSRLVAVLIEAVKEQQGQIEELKDAVKSLLTDKSKAAGLA